MKLAVVIPFLNEAAALPATLDALFQAIGAFGTVDDCVKSLSRFIDAGADEIATYGSTPAQNGRLVTAWRERA